MPRFSESTRPASFSLAMWCEMVGWPRPRPAVKSQMQIGPSAFHSDASMVRRVGSANAFINLEVLAAQFGLTAGSSQHAPRSLIIGAFNATRQSYENPSTVVDAMCYAQRIEVHRSKGVSLSWVK